MHLRRFFASALTLAALSLASTASASTTTTIGGIDFTADWTGNALVQNAQGDVQVGNMSLFDADLYYNAFFGYLSASATISMDLGACELDAPDVALGFADGADILNDVDGTAPVVEGQSYLYFDIDTNTALYCGGFAMPLAGVGSAKLYINPSDPSVYVRVAGIGDLVDAAGGALKKMMPVGLDEAYVGVSAKGLLPWTANHALGNAKPEVDAHLIIGGTFEFKAGPLPLKVVDGSIAMRMDSETGIEDVCIDGALALPGFVVAGIGILDIPLGNGTACVTENGTVLDFQSTQDSADWYRNLGLHTVPAKLLDMLNTSSSLRKVTGHLDLDAEAFSLSFDGSMDLGFADADVTVTIDNSGLAVDGSAKVGFLGTTFGGFSVSSKVGLSGAALFLDGNINLGIYKLDATFTTSINIFGKSYAKGIATSKIGGGFATVKGNFKFEDRKPKSIELKAGVDLKICKGKLILKVKGSGEVKVKAKGSVSPFGSFEVSVSSKGKFSVFGFKVDLW